MASIDKHVGQITSGSIRQPSVIPHTTVGNYTAINTSSTSNAYSNGKMSIEPINLNLNGSIKLTSDKGVSKDIDINTLLADDDAEKLSSEKFWYDVNNINNKFVISQIDAEYLKLTEAEEKLNDKNC